MSWWQAVPVVLAVLFVAMVPGAAALAALGVRGAALLGLAAPASACVLGGGAIVVGLLGLRWGALVALVVTLVLVLVAAVLRRLFGPPQVLREPLPPTGGRILAGCMGVAAVVGAVPLAVGMMRLDRPVQTYDAVFHMNALRYIAETGQASSLLLGGMNNQVAEGGYYPAGWHVIGGTVVGLLDADPAAVANATTLVLAGVVLPAGTALAARVLMPDWRWAAGVGAILGTFFAALPTLMVSWGTLFPNAWATAMLPALLAATVMCLRRPDVASWLAVVAAGVGALLVHPSALFGFGLLGFPFIVQAATRRWRRLDGESRRPRLAAEIAALGVAGLALVYVLFGSPLLDSVRAFRWPRNESMPQAVGEALFDAPLSLLVYGIPAASWLLGGLTVLGIVQAARNRRQQSWVWSLVLAVAAFVVCAGAANESILRDYVSGFWYNDPVRLAGQVPVVAAPLAALGVGAVAAWLRSIVLEHGQALGGRVHALARLVGVPLVVVLLLALTNGGYADKRSARLHHDYRYVPQSADGSPQQSLTPAEEDLMRNLGDVGVPADALILADPFNGGALAYALGKRQVVFPHMTGQWSDEALDLREKRLYLDNRRTCEAVRELGIDYLYTDEHSLAQGSFLQEKFEPLNDAPRKGLREVASADNATLYEITMCS